MTVAAGTVRPRWRAILESALCSDRYFNRNPVDGMAERCRSGSARLKATAPSLPLLNKKGVKFKEMEPGIKKEGKKNNNKKLYNSIGERILSSAQRSKQKPSRDGQRKIGRGWDDAGGGMVCAKAIMQSHFILYWWIGSWRADRGDGGLGKSL